MTSDLAQCQPDYLINTFHKFTKSTELFDVENCYCDACYICFVSFK